MLLGDDICLRKWQEMLQSKEMLQPTDLDVLTEHVFRGKSSVPIICDCTASDGMSVYYEQWLRRGINVVAANKKANSGPHSVYRAIRDAERCGKTAFRYEANVGAGLPIISTLRDLLCTGDKVLEVEGVLSGTLSYIFNEFDGSESFSAIVRRAKDRGFTEPDPRDDLSGTDIARKVVILAREIGLQTELDQVHVQNLVPEQLRGPQVSISSFLDELVMWDSKLTALAQDALSEEKKLLYVSYIDAKSGQCGVELRSYPVGHPFARLHGTDNIFTIRTERYDTQPMLVQGPGAGAAVTAAGVFSDILKIAFCA